MKVLKEYLFRNNLTVKEFAFELKISAAYLYQLVSGDRKPSLKLAQKIENCTRGEIRVSQLLNADFRGKPCDIKTAEEGNDLQKIENCFLEIEKKIKWFEKMLNLIEKSEKPNG